MSKISVLPLQFKEWAELYARFDWSLPMIYRRTGIGESFRIIIAGVRDTKKHLRTNMHVVPFPEIYPGLHWWILTSFSQTH